MRREIYALLQAHRGVTMFAAPTMVKRLVDFPGDADTAQPQDHRLRRRPDVRGRLQGGAGALRLQARADLRPGRIAHDHHRHGQGASTPRPIIRATSSASPRSARPSPASRSGSPTRDDRPLPAGEIGEILVRGDPVMAGYWDNPAASAETLRDGWLHTGDVGSLDEEGFLTLKDRSKDVIISGGSNIYPREVEEVLLLHPGVSEVSVVGEPDPEWGEVVIAFIVPARAPSGHGRTRRAVPGPHRPLQAAQSLPLSTRCPRTAPARCSRPSCAGYCIPEGRGGVRPVREAGGRIRVSPPHNTRRPALPASDGPAR